jgi:hypothetical protein
VAAYEYSIHEEKAPMPVEDEIFPIPIEEDH